MVSLQPKLNLKISQRQILTPGLMQMVSVLALNKLELKDMIQAEIAENPVLEELEETVPMIDHVAEPDQQAAPDTKPDAFDEIDFGSYFQEYLDPGFRSPQSFEVNEKPSLESYLSKPGSLQDHLGWQIGSLSLSPPVRDAAEYIVGNLNEDGYLGASEEDLLEGYRAQIEQHLLAHPEADGKVAQRAVLESLEETLTQALAIVRGLDPTGIAARDLRGCLLAQIQAARRDAAAQQRKREKIQQQERESEAENHWSLEEDSGAREIGLSPLHSAESSTSVPALLFVQQPGSEAAFGSNGSHGLSNGDYPPGGPSAYRQHPGGETWQPGAEDWSSFDGELAASGAPAPAATPAAVLIAAPVRDSVPQHPQSAIFNIAERIVDKHLLLLQKRDLREVAKAVSTTVEQANLAFDFIRTLDPRPGQRFNCVDARLIEPDVAFIKRDDEYVAVMDDESVPTLRLNQGYRRLLKQATAEKDVKDYVKERYRSALQLMRNIEQRKNTILRTCEVIVRRQGDFLERGVEALRPMMIKEVAEEIGVHPSTVSRAVSNKYVHTPQGVFELRFFFTEAVNGPEGSGTPLLLLKRKVKKLIEEEDARKPLTDELITHMLQTQGYDVTRRTVAKYREDLRIPSTHQRRVRD